MSGTSGPEDSSPLKFPCEFPIKVMGRQEDDFEAHVVALVGGHVGTLDAARVRTRPSANGRFLSVTVTIAAVSREQLDGIYRSLTASERVLFVL